MSYTAYKVLVYLFLINSTYGQTCDPNAKPKTNSQLIKEKILCKSNKSTRPGYSTHNKTEVTLILSPITLEYVDSSAELRMQTWIEMFWNDDNFKWNEKEYKNTEMVYVEASQVWVPDLFLVNWKDDTVFVDKVCSTVVVGKDGWLYTSIIPVLKGHCIPDWTKWPFDIQNCEFQLTSRQYLGNEVDFMIPELEDNKGLFMKDYIPSREWELIDHKAERKVFDYGQFNGTAIYRVEIKIFMTIRRHASVLVSSYIMPGFVMMLMSLAILWFNPFTSQRIPIISVLVLLQSLFLQYLAYKIPSNGSKTPGIVIFYGGSLIITTILLLLTMLTNSMGSWTSKPNWLSTVLNRLRTNRILQLVLIVDVKTYIEFEKNEEGVSEHSKLQGDKEWQEFAIALNRIAFTILLPVYLILFLHFIV